MLYTSDFGAVGRDGDGFGARLEVGKLVEGSDGCFAGGGFTGGYVDFGCAGLEEARSVSRDSLEGGLEIPRSCVESEAS